MDVALQFAVLYVILMFFAVFRKEAIGPSIIAAVGMVAVYPDMERARLLVIMALVMFVFFVVGHND